MNEKSQHCVDVAIAYANGSQHEGHGYYLRVELENGSVIEGAVSGTDNDNSDVLLLLEATSVGDPAEVFIDKRRIVMAKVVW